MIQRYFPCFGDYSVNKSVFYSKRSFKSELSIHRQKTKFQTDHFLNKKKILKDSAE